MPAAPTIMALPRRGLRRAVLLVLGMALFLGFVSLGTWQVQRRTSVSYTHLTLPTKRIV